MQDFYLCHSISPLWFCYLIKYKMCVTLLLRILPVQVRAADEAPPQSGWRDRVSFRDVCSGEGLMAPGAHNKTIQEKSAKPLRKRKKREREADREFPAHPLPVQQTKSWEWAQSRSSAAACNLMKVDCAHLDEAPGASWRRWGNKNNNH